MFKKREYKGDIRPTSYNAATARPFGQTAEQIRIDAKLEREFEVAYPSHRRKPHSDRYWLLTFLGLNPADYGVS